MDSFTFLNKINSRDDNKHKQKNTEKNSQNICQSDEDIEG